MLDSDIHHRLRKYGNVFSQRRGKLNDFPGVRHVLMDIHTPIPSFLRFGRFLLRVYYDDQPRICRICNSLDYLSRDYANVACFNCVGIGYESRECPENMRCCIYREEDHMAIDCPHSWSIRPASYRKAERETPGVSEPDAVT